MNDPVLIALSTCPDEASARQIAEDLVRGGLAACVNRIPGVRSTYFWDGRLQDEGEILLIIKTTAGRWSALEARLGEIHPYEVPELIALASAHGNDRYLQWVRSAVEQPRSAVEQHEGRE